MSGLNQYSQKKKSKMEERKGFLLPEQIKKLEKILKLKGVLGIVDGPILKLIDDLLLEKLKAKINNPEEVLPMIYLIIDEIFNAIDVEALAAEIAQAKLQAQV